VYTLDEMLSQAMADAYARQASYAAFAEAFPDSRSLVNLTVDPQIVLLEMLLKAHDMALPAPSADVPAAETEADAYLAAAQAENNAVVMLRSYLSQEALTEDAQMIFRMVLNDSRQNASRLAAQVRAARRAQDWADFMNSDSTKKYVYEGTGPRGGQWTMYVITNSTDDEQPGTAPQDTQEPVTDETETAVEEGADN
jgi:hypothetical protein